MKFSLKPDRQILREFIRDFIVSCSIILLTWLVFFLPVLAENLKETDDYCAVTLHPDESYHVSSTGYRELRVFKFQPREPAFLFPFADAQFKFDKVPSDIQLHLASSCNDIQESADKMSFSNIVEWIFTKRQTKAIPAMDGMVGISSAKDYTIMVDYENVNIYRLGAFLGAGLLFFYSEFLCHQAFSVYASSAFLGIFASLVFLALFMRKFLPRSFLFLPLEWILWPVVSYVYYYGYANFYDIAKEHWKFLAGYMAISAFVSIVVCYVSGVTQNVRLQNVFQWLLQAIAATIIMFSSHNIWFSIGAIFTLISITQGLYRPLVAVSQWLYSFIFRAKPVHVMLTEEEYKVQGEETTRIELEKLRQYMAENCRTLTSKTGTPLKKLRSSEVVGSFILTGNDVSMRSMHEHSAIYGDSADITDDSDSETDMPVPESLNKTSQSSNQYNDLTDDSDNPIDEHRYGWRAMSLNESRTPKSRNFNWRSHLK